MGPLDTQLFSSYFLSICSEFKHFMNIITSILYSIPCISAVLTPANQNKMKDGIWLVGHGLPIPGLECMCGGWSESSHLGPWGESIYWGWQRNKLEGTWVPGYQRATLWARERRGREVEQHAQGHQQVRGWARVCTQACGTLKSVLLTQPCTISDQGFGALTLASQHSSSLL